MLVPRDFVGNLVGEVDLGLRVGDLDLERRTLGRVKEEKLRFPNNFSSLRLTRKCCSCEALVSSALGMLLRFGESDRERDWDRDLVGVRVRDAVELLRFVIRPSSS